MLEHGAEAMVMVEDKLAYEVFELCKKHYGASKFQKDWPTFYVKNDEEDILAGEFCGENNEIMINMAYVHGKEELIRTITHEFIHYLQSPTWMKRYHKVYDYYNHPYEVEAYSRENELLELI